MGKDLAAPAHFRWHIAPLPPPACSLFAMNVQLRPEPMENPAPYTYFVSVSEKAALHGLEGLSMFQGGPVLLFLDLCWAGPQAFHGGPAHWDRCWQFPACAAASCCAASPASGGRIRPAALRVNAPAAAARPSAACQISVSTGVLALLVFSGVLTYCRWKRII